MGSFKSSPIFAKTAELEKASLDTYSWGGWLISHDFLNKWVVEGVPSDPHDFDIHWMVSSIDVLGLMTFHV